MHIVSKLKIEKSSVYLACMSSLIDSQDANPKWKIHSKPATILIANRLIQIHDSIWYSTNYMNGEQGMVEYCLKSNTTKQIVKYPSDIKPVRHALCRYQNKIYIIDQTAGIIEFDPSTKQFNKKVAIANIGFDPSAIAIQDTIHIYNGDNNNKSIAFIYIPFNNVIHTVKDENAKHKISSSSLLLHDKNLIRFGGYNHDTSSYGNEFMIARKIKNEFTMNVINAYVHGTEYKLKLEQIPSDITNLIYEFFCTKNEYVWSKIEKFRLMNKIGSCSCVLYKDFIIAFSGKSDASKREYNDKIFILDLTDQDKGWIELSMKCPVKCKYRTILTTDNNVHLFKWFGPDREPGHFSISMASLLQDVEIDEKK